MGDKKLLRILFVEDSADDMELLLEELRNEYAEILHQRVDSAHPLRAALEQEKWDVIICDHNLPALDAPSALRIVQEKRNDIPFIIVSGLIEENTAVAAMMSGAADTISKDKLSRLVPAVKREVKKASTIRDLRKAREHIDRLAYYDQLTGLPNRESLARYLDGLLDQPVPPEKPAMLVININRFRHIPRTLGVGAANHVLRVVAERIRESVMEAGFAARLGGDRFAVLLHDVADTDAVIRSIDMIREKLIEALKISGQELFLTCSLGASVYPRDGRDFHELLANAETAMYQARTDNGSNYLFFDSGMNAIGQEQLILEHALHRAIKQEEFLIHYQPQFDLRNGRMIGVEALLRWQPADGGLVSPDKFIPLLEETGLIVPVGEWVLRTACTQNLDWQKADMPPFRVAVNLSAVQFQQPDLVPMVRRVLEETGLDPRWLELEITESIAMYNEEFIIATLSELNSMGVSLAIDDFGTGYSSLGYLKRFPVHKLKIDRSFIKDITGAKNGGSIVKAIVSLAQNLELGVIAEGVETEIQSAFLHSCGCNEVQGFLFSQPLSSEKIESLLRGEGFAPPANLFSGPIVVS